MDKKVLNEELNVMKYLFQYDRGVVVSEQKSKRINEAGIYEPDNLGVDDILGKLKQESGASDEAAELAVCTAPEEVTQEVKKTGDSNLAKLFQKINSLDLSSLKNLYRDVKSKMTQQNEQAAAAAGTMILGIPVSYVLLGLVLLGVLTAMISRMGGGGGRSSGSGCRAARKARARGQGIWGDVHW